jgi:hypothetical protein
VTGDTGSRRGRSLRLCCLVFLSSFQITAHFANAFRARLCSHVLPRSLAETAKRQERIHAGHGITVEKCLNTGVSIVEIPRERLWVTTTICRAQDALISCDMSRLAFWQQVRRRMLDICWDAAADVNCLTLYPCELTSRN